MPKTSKVTDFQEKVYTLLLQIPSGKITTYASLARALHTSPRAVGNALRNNPFAPEVPCHRVVASTGFIGGFMGECEKAPSGVNQMRKRALLKGEGVEFDELGMVLLSGVDGGRKMKAGKTMAATMTETTDDDVWFNGPWDLTGKLSREKIKEQQRP